MKRSEAMILVLLMTLSTMVLVDLDGPADAAQSKKDAGGYMYTDGKEPEPKVDCDYIDVSSDMNSVPWTVTDYYGYKQSNLPFSFNYYDNTYSSVYIGHNGVMTFVYTANLGNYLYSYYNHGTIPNSQQPRGVIAAYWSNQANCVDSSNPRVYTLSTKIDGENVFIVEWNPTQGGKFEVILFESGTIKFQYLSAPTGWGYSVGAYTIIGIEKYDDTTGLQYCRYEYRTTDLFTVPFAIQFHKEEIQIREADLENGDGYRGDMIYAGSKEYTFSALVYHSQTREALFLTTLTLAPKYEDVRFLYFPDNKTVVQLTGFTIASAVPQGTGHTNIDERTIKVVITVDFNITYPSEEARNFTFSASGRSAIPAKFTPDISYTVENDLEWSMDKVRIRLEDMQEIPSDGTGYIAGMTKFQIHNLRMVYQGTNDIQPRTTVAHVMLFDNFDTLKKVFITQGKYLQTNWVSTDTTTKMRFSALISGVPPENIVPEINNPYTFSLNVDTNPPSFIGELKVHPDSETDPPSFIDDDYRVFLNWSEAEDTESGIKGYRLEARSGDFRVIKEIPIVSAPPSRMYELGRSVSDELPEGTINISVRAIDNVGNLGPVAFVHLINDHTGPSFELVGPEPGSWVRESRPTVQVKVMDALSGIDGTSLMYRWSKDGGFTWSDWERVSYYGQGEAEHVIGINPALSEGRDNLVEVRGYDMAASEETRSEPFPVFVDTRPPVISLMDLTLDEAKSTTQWISDIKTPLKISIHDTLGSGLDLQKISYRYSTNGGETFSTDLPIEAEPFNNTKGYQEIQYLIRKPWSEGEGNLLVIDAYDLVGRNSTRVFRIRMDVTPNITGIDPVSGSVFFDNQSIPFSIQVDDPDGEGDLTFTWMSNRVGIFSSEQDFRTNLPAGDHIITITVKDKAHTLKRTISVTVLDHLLEDPEKKDSDGDGMNDAFEDRYKTDQLNGIKGLDKNTPDSQNDLDGDSYTNYQEYLAGTDPLDKGSYPGSTVLEERFPILPLAFMLVGLLLVLIMAVLVVIESRRSPPVPMYQMNQLAYYQGPGGMQASAQYPGQQAGVRANAPQVR